MRKTLIGLAASLAVATSAFANSDPTPSVQLHSKPDIQSKLVTQPIAVTEPLVVILYSPDKQWAKVANRHDGSVGWINKKDYLSAMQAHQKPDFQTVIVSTDRNNGKTTQTVVAFRNGKPLSSEQAQKLYDKLKSQYLLQQSSFYRQQRAMREIEHDFFHNETDIMHPLFEQSMFPGQLPPENRRPHRPAPMPTLWDGDNN